MKDFEFISSKMLSTLSRIASNRNTPLSNEINCYLNKIFKNPNEVEKPCNCEKLMDFVESLEEAGVENAREHIKDKCPDCGADLTSKRLYRAHKALDALPKRVVKVECDHIVRNFPTSGGSLITVDFSEHIGWCCPVCGQKIIRI